MADTRSSSTVDTEVAHAAEVMPQAMVPYQKSYIPVATQTGPARPARPPAAFSAAMGQPRSMTRLALATTLQAGIISAGLYAAGIRKPSQLILGSLASSATLSLILTGYHAARARRTW